MAKRIILIFATAILAITTAGCTTAGVECGLVGKWEYLGMTNEKLICEFTADDEFIWQYLLGETRVTKKAKIKSVNNGCIKLDYADYYNLGNSSISIDCIYYQDLGCEAVRLKFSNSYNHSDLCLNFRKVY